MMSISQHSSKIYRIFETIHDKMGFKHLESQTRNEDNSTDIYI